MSAGDRAEQARVTVNPGHVVHAGAHAFVAGDTVALPAGHAAALVASGVARPEGEAEPSPPAPDAQQPA